MTGLVDLIKSSIVYGIFPDKLKLAEITRVSKNGNNQSLGDYRPISIFPAVSKLFEKAIAVQIEAHFENLRLSKLLCGFRKRQSTQHPLLQLLEKMQKGSDNADTIGTIVDVFGYESMVP